MLVTFLRKVKQFCENKNQHLSIVKNQLQTQKKRLINLREEYLKSSNERFVIVCDEWYFTLAGSNCAENNTYYLKKKVDIHTDVKFKRDAKFSKQILVWLAFSAKGRSAAPSGPSVN